VPLRFFSETLGSPDYSSWEDLFGQNYPFPLSPVPSSPAARITGAILGWFTVDSLANPGLRETLAVTVAGVSWGYNSVTIDFEGLGADESTRQKDATNLTATR
jgi:hypothetical protein